MELWDINGNPFLVASVTWGHFSKTSEMTRNKSSLHSGKKKDYQLHADCFTTGKETGSCS